MPDYTGDHVTREGPVSSLMEALHVPANCTKSRPIMRLKASALLSDLHAPCPALSRKFRLENVKRSGPATPPEDACGRAAGHRPLQGPWCRGRQRGGPPALHARGFSTGTSGATPAPVLQLPGAHCPVPQIPEERGSSPSPHSSLCPQLPLQVSTQMRSTHSHIEVYTRQQRSTPLRLCRHTSFK